MRIAYMIGALVGRSLAAEDVDVVMPSANGTFFYADLKSDDNYQSHMDVKVGSNNDTIKLQLTVDEVRAAVMTLHCSKTYCNVPHRYDLKASKSIIDFDKKSKETTEAVNLLKDRSLIKTRYNGDVHTDRFTFTFEEYGRELSHNITFLGITDSTVKMKSDYTGFLGLQPYTALGGKDAVKDMSFLVTLQRDKLIDDLIVSLFIDYQTGNSTVKFGGWDKHALKKGTKLELYKTKSTNSWAIEGESFTFQDYKTSTQRYF